MKKVLFVLLALAMLVSVVSVFAEESIEGKVVAFIPKLTGNSFFEAANDGAQKYAAEWGIEVRYMGSAVASVTDQLEVIQQAIDAGVDAIAISSVDATALDEKLQEARDMGIVVTTWDSDVSSNSRTRWSPRVCLPPLAQCWSTWVLNP